MSNEAFHGVTAFQRRFTESMLTKHEQKAKEIPPFNRDLIIHIGVCISYEDDGGRLKIVESTRNTTDISYID